MCQQQYLSLATLTIFHHFWRERPLTSMFCSSKPYHTVKTPYLRLSSCAQQSGQLAGRVPSKKCLARAEVMQTLDDEHFSLSTLYWKHLAQQHCVRLCWASKKRDRAMSALENWAPAFQSRNKPMNCFGNSCAGNPLSSFTRLYSWQHHLLRQTSVSDKINSSHQPGAAVRQVL